MTPKEKASQMIVDYQLTIKSLGYEEAVQCAIRTVDDILQELELVCVDEMVQFSNRWKYWAEVKELLEKQINKMTLRHALLILQSHQKWRMGDEFTQATEPKVLTEAINTILQYHVGSTTALIDQIGEVNEMVDQVPDVRKMVEDDNYLTPVDWLMDRIKWIHRETYDYLIKEGQYDVAKRTENAILDKTNELQSSQTEISDEEIEKAAMDSMDYVYLNPYDSLIFHQGWMRAIKWYREQLKQRQ